MPPLKPSRFGGVLSVTRAGFTAIRPAVPFVLGAGAVAGVTLLGGKAVEGVVDAFTKYRAEGSPPLQINTIDPDPTKVGDEIQTAFDRRTGRLLVFGQPPTHQVGPERAVERQVGNSIWVLGLVGGALLIFFLLQRRGK